jgi:cytochrome c oxidase subunit 4
MSYSASVGGSSSSPGHGAAGIAHVVPASVLLTVFVVLMVLTAATLAAATWVHLGPWNLWIALGIATVKASLVALYFMHLRYDNPFYALIFVTALVFLGMFLILTLLDTLQYAPSITNWPK